jgi:threonine dehydratase
MPGVERILVPVGGGGLACGVAKGLNALGSHVRVVGVQSDGYPLWPAAIEAGGAVSLTPQTIADGTAAPFDPKMFEMVRKHVHQWIVIPEKDVRAAVRALVTDVKVVVEGAGALAYAAMTRDSAPHGTVAILSGGNIDASKLRDCLSTEAGSQRT